MKIEKSIVMRIITWENLDRPSGNNEIEHYYILYMQEMKLKTNNHKC